MELFLSLRDNSAGLDSCRCTNPHSAMAPSDWVVRWSALLPAGASVLDVACGRGRHARWLAERGRHVVAVDRDAQALAPLRGLAGLNGSVEVVEADLETGSWPLPGRRFDAVVMTHYLWRPLFPVVLSSLAPNGALICETFNVDHAAIGKPSNPQFLLRHGELLELAQGLRVLGYEDGFLSDPDRQVQRIAAVRLLPSDAAGGVSSTALRHPL